MDLSAHIGAIPDFPKAGILFRDISPLLAEPRAFRECLRLLGDHARSLGVTHLAGIESRGFVFAAPLAVELEVGLVLLRKPGKLPGTVLRRDYTLEYGDASLELQSGRLGQGDRVLILDDLLATGGTALAAAELVEEAGASVVGLAFVIELTGIGGRAALARWPVFRLLEFEA